MFSLKLGEQSLLKSIVGCCFVAHVSIHSVIIVFICLHYIQQHFLNGIQHTQFLSLHNSLP